MKLNEESKEKNMYLHAPFEIFFQPKSRIPNFLAIKKEPSKVNRCELDSSQQSGIVLIFGRRRITSIGESCS